MTRLSIVTATIPERAESMSRLYGAIRSQSHNLSVEHVIVTGNGTVGRKMNTGFRQAKGDYVCVIDDDDTIADDYVKTLLYAMVSAPDVVTFGVRMDTNTVWLRANRDVDTGLTKLANHLCAWRRELALTAPFLPRNYGWDAVWYWSLQASKRNDLREEHVHRVLYNYNYSPTGTRAQSRESIADSIDNNGAKINIVRLEDGRIAAGPSLDRMWVQNMEILDLTTAKVELLKELVFT